MVVAGMESVARVGLDAVAGTGVDSVAGVGGAAVAAAGAAVAGAGGVAGAEAAAASAAGVVATVRSTVGVCEGRVICCAGDAVVISANASRADAELAEVMFMYASKNSWQRTFYADVRPKRTFSGGMTLEGDTRLRKGAKGFLAFALHVSTQKQGNASA
jgi:hypothetical protein